MEIIDIQKIKENGIHEKFEITFATEEGYECAKIIMSKDDMWQIAHYCQDELSLGAQRKKKRDGKGRY